MLMILSWQRSSRCVFKQTMSFCNVSACLRVCRASLAAIWNMYIAQYDTRELDGVWGGVVIHRFYQIEPRVSTFNHQSTGIQAELVWPRGITSCQRPREGVASWGNMTSQAICDATAWTLETIYQVSSIPTADRKRIS